MMLWWRAVCEGWIGNSVSANKQVVRGPRTERERELVTACDERSSSGSVGAGGSGLREGECNTKGPLSRCGSPGRVLCLGTPAVKLAVKLD